MTTAGQRRFLHHAHCHLFLFTSVASRATCTPRRSSGTHVQKRPFPVCQRPAQTTRTAAQGRAGGERLGSTPNQPWPTTMSPTASCARSPRWSCRIPCPPRTGTRMRGHKSCAGAYVPLPACSSCLRAGWRRPPPAALLYPAPSSLGGLASCIANNPHRCCAASPPPPALPRRYWEWFSHTRCAPACFG